MQPEKAVPKAEKKVTLYLQPWQKRMLHDFSHVELKPNISKIILQIGPHRCPTSYEILPDFMKKEDWWIYLSDEQIMQVQEELDIHTAVNFVHITAENLKNQTVMFA
jgi:hypothetical protein